MCVPAQAETQLPPGLKGPRSGGAPRLEPQQYGCLAVDSCPVHFRDQLRATAKHGAVICKEVADFKTREEKVQGESGAPCHTESEEVPKGIMVQCQKDPGPARRTGPTENQN
jgi:hypothetical protein